MRMKLALKTAVYIALVALAVFSIQRLFGAWTAKMEVVDQRFNDVDELGSRPAVVTVPGTDPGESEASAETNGLNLSLTNRAELEGTNVVASGGTNAPGGGEGELSSSTPGPTMVESAPAGSSMGLDGACALFSVLAIAGLLARDVSRYIGQRAYRGLYNEDSEGIADPVYDEAEKVWANGDHLEAIRLLREFLKKNPRGVHAAFRIAEIYEKELRNELAAALEYEEILKCKLDAERWGWAAVHLCNLYYHMDQPAKADALLQRLATDYGHTAAAKKARKRLGLPEADSTKSETAPATTAPEAPAETSNLPRGFRPRDR